MTFFSPEGIEIPALTTEQMREVDRIAVEDFHLGILQMMENAGRNLAQLARMFLGDQTGPVTVLSGPGGNGGGGLSCARHLLNHGVEVHLAVTKPLSELRGAVASQLDILHKAGYGPLELDQVGAKVRGSPVVVDAILGYSLQGAPRGRVAEWINIVNELAHTVVSLDVPSGVHSTTGETPGVAVKPDVTLTLALPKTGLASIEGDLYLADIGIPPQVYAQLDVHFKPFFNGRYLLPLTIKQP